VSATTRSARSPRLLVSEERILLGHPLMQVPHGRRCSWSPDPCEAPALGFPLIGLHPHQRIDQVRGFAAPGTNLSMMSRDSWPERQWIPAAAAFAQRAIC